MLAFNNLGLSPELLENVTRLGYQAPTLIQQKAIPLLLNADTDVVALAQTGTGKTAAFGLPLVDLCDDSSRIPQALVLAPTRELCVQITSDFVAYANGVKNLNIVAVYGGASISEQMRSIKKGCQIVVATPGRLIDLLERKVIDLAQIAYFILDEADEMLKMGFQDAIDTILSHTNPEKRVWLFSATMPAEISTIAKNYMHKPTEISVGTRNQTNENIIHQYVLTSDRDRYPALKRLIDYNTDIYGVIFCRTKMDTQEVADKLLADGYNADALHGDLSQPQRDKVLNNFRLRSLQLLVATDVAARGIDVTDISHVIHLNLPDEQEYYTHRAGRTARAGKTGISLAIVTRKDLFRLQQIEKKLKTRFEQIPIPTGIEICHSKMRNMIAQLENVTINKQEIAPFLPALNQSLADFTKEDVIARFASLEFNHFLDYYRNAVDLNIIADTPRGATRSTAGTSSPAYDRYPVGTRLFINLGKMDDLEKMDLLQLISQATGIPKRDINHIKLKGAYSFFEVDESLTDRVFKGLHGKRFEDRPIRIERTGEGEKEDFSGKKSGKSKDKKKKSQRKYK